MATILVVDDRAINREFLATLLSYAGYAVLQAGNGAEALALVREQRPDLVITDVLMPVMDGAEFAERVHADAAIAATPILFYTATYRATEARALAQSCGVLGVLAKPAEPQRILDAVAAALGEPADAPAPDDVAPLPAPTKLPGHLRDLTAAHARLLDSARANDPSAAQAAYSLNSLSLRLAAALELDLALAAEREERQMLELFVRATQDIIDCRYAGIGLLDAQGARLEHFATRGLDADQQRKMAAALDPRAGVLGRVLGSGRPYRSAAGDPLPAPFAAGDVHPPVSSLLVVPVPVRSATSVSGWLYLADRIGADAFEDDDEQFAITLAAQFALAFGNLSLYDEIQRRAAELEIEVIERRRAQDALAYRATHDQVTGLPRFMLIEERLEEALAEARARAGRVVMLYVDIDRFHMVNETRGRAVGDEVLRAIAQRLLEIAGRSGIVAQVAADEFAVVFAGAQAAQDALDLAEAVRWQVQQPIGRAGQRIHVSCSVGVSCFPDNGASAQELLRQAEAAMKRAKADGRNAVRAFANEDKQALDDRMSVGLGLNDALRNRELLLHYQPLVDCRDWRILGFEALVRWQHPQHGLLGPARFLDIAEDLGLMFDIGSYVLDSACRQARAWLDRGASDFVVSVNVSAQQLERPDFVDQVRATLESCGVPARCLELELTESMTSGNIERVIDTMQAFKALGVGLALDDFGTGWSSLNLLRRFPIDKLKIDKSFVLDISSDAGAAGVCRAIIALGHEIGMKVLAEGVETAAQVGYLRRNECDQFQGYHFSKPLPAADAFELLRFRYMKPQGVEQERQPTLLLLDDEENILRALIRTLRRDGYRILTAQNVDEAFDLLARNDVQVIVSDQRMPGASGTDFLGQVKGMYPDTVRMILSGYADIGAVTDAINRGAVYKFLSKPWSDEDLRTHIQLAFREHEARRRRTPADG